MFIRLRERLHDGAYKVYALNLNAYKRVTIVEDDDRFILALDMEMDPPGKHIVIERYKTEEEAINAFESLMDAVAEGDPLWDARTTRNT